jgi:hypothetical protein
VVAGWLSPVLIALTVVLLGRSFYIIYVQKRGSLPVKVLTWCSAAFVVVFWTCWYREPLLALAVFILGGWR